MIVLSQLVENLHTFWMCRQPRNVRQTSRLLVVDRFPLPLVAPPIDDTSFTHVMRLAAHSTTSPTLTAMGQR
jgi:hypothetical protein